MILCTVRSVRISAAFISPCDIFQHFKKLFSLLLTEVGHRASSPGQCGLQHVVLFYFFVPPSCRDEGLLAHWIWKVEFQISRRKNT